VAKNDKIADPKDTKDVMQDLSNVVFYRVYEDQDHLSLSMAKDMSYFKDVLGIMEKYYLQEIIGIS
jgi:hypothetical protein